MNDAMILATDVCWHSDTAGEVTVTLFDGRKHTVRFSEPSLVDGVTTFEQAERLAIAWASGAPVAPADQA